MIRIAVGVWHRIGTPESAMAETVSGVDVKPQGKRGSERRRRVTQ